MLKFSHPLAIVGATVLALGTGVAQAQGLSNGTPQVMGFRDHGKPVVSYGPQGATPGISNGMPVVTGTQHGEPQITYQPVRDAGAGRSFADGGLPDAPGAAGITYTRPVARAPRVADVPAAPAVVRPVAMRRPMPAAVESQIVEAKQALADRQPANARDELERAETQLLNARHDGEHGWHREIQALADARNAIARHDDPGAASGLASLVARG